MEHDNPNLVEVYPLERLMPSDGKRDRDINLEVQSALQASGFVGTWENDLIADRVYLSGSLIELVGLTPERAAIGVPLGAFLDGIHPEDQERVSKLVREAHATVGRFGAQFRTVRPDGSIHWVSARGQVEADAEGRGVRCLGMAVDITDARIEESDDETRLSVIERLVDSLIALRKLLARDETSVLNHLIDMLLLELGSELSKPKREPRIDQLH